MAGAIVMWGGTKDTIPGGWLECDGTPVDCDQYLNLFTAIQYNFGANPPENQFYLPDLRGRFVRGVDDGADRDPDVNSRQDMQDSSMLSTTVGSVQSHAFQDHTHGYEIVQTESDIGDNDGICNGHDLENVSGTTTDPQSGNTSSETRPINAYLYYIIEY